MMLKENRVGTMGTGGDVSGTSRWTLVRDRNENAEMGQEEDQENVREERHLNKLFEFSL